MGEEFKREGTFHSLFDHYVQFVVRLTAEFVVTTGSSSVRLRGQFIARIQCAVSGPMSFG